MSPCKSQEALGLVARKNKGTLLKDVVPALFAENPTRPVSDKPLKADSESERERERERERDVRNNGRVAEMEGHGRSKIHNASGRGK
jgi:hypothetical protein